MSKPADLPTLDDLRQRIDALDSQLLQLLNQRAQCAEQVGEVKRANGDDPSSFYRPDREAKILRRMQAENQGPLSGTVVTHLFREVISSCLALEQALKVAYLGPAGTFTHAAVQKHFGHAVTPVAADSISQVFRDVQAGEVDYGVVPIENSTEGVVSHTLDQFINAKVFVTGEVQMPIHHNILVKNLDTYTPEAVTRVFSHQQTLGQCRAWLNMHMPQAELIPVSSNARAATVLEDDHDVAIASDVAANLYDLQVAQRNIEDQPDNSTRFIVLGRQQFAPSGNDKTTLLLSAKNKAGALFNLLQPFADHHVDMTRIESRPSKSANWEYLFFVDINGHAEEDGIARALSALGDEAKLLRVLGSYPKAIL